MKYEEFKAVCPHQTAITEENFAFHLLQAETIVQSWMVYGVAELTACCLEVYKKALALQLDHIVTEGAMSGDITSQTINGVTTSFAVRAGGVAMAKASPLALNIIRGAGLCVRF